MTRLRRNLRSYFATSEPQNHEVCLASQSIPTSNQILSWLKGIEGLRKLLPEVSGLPLVMGN